MLSLNVAFVHVSIFSRWDVVFLGGMRTIQVQKIHVLISLALFLINR